MKRLIILFLSAAAFAACSPVRHCKTPELDLPERLAGADGDSLTAADLGWWQFYGDPALRRIIERTLAENKDMLAAADVPHRQGGPAARFHGWRIGR